MPNPQCVVNLSQMTLIPIVGVGQGKHRDGSWRSRGHIDFGHCLRQPPEIHHEFTASPRVLYAIFNKELVKSYLGIGGYKFFRDF